jgi:hypothetical protein
MKHLYIIQVHLDRWTPVGPWYRNKSTAGGWVPFVKAGWLGIPTRVRRYTVSAARKVQDGRSCCIELGATHA